jgi:predicted dehydrogenase
MKAEGSRLVAGSRRNREEGEKMAEALGIEKFYTNYKQLVHDPDVDAIYVGTPVDSHYEIGIHEFFFLSSYFSSRYLFSVGIGTTKVKKNF